MLGYFRVSLILGQALNTFSIIFIFKTYTTKLEFNINHLMTMCQRNNYGQSCIYTALSIGIYNIYYKRSCVRGYKMELGAMQVPIIIAATSILTFRYMCVAI